MSFECFGKAIGPYPHIKPLSFLAHLLSGGERWRLQKSGGTRKHRKRGGWREAAEQGYERILLVRDLHNLD